MRGSVIVLVRKEGKVRAAEMGVGGEYLRTEVPEVQYLGTRKRGRAKNKREGKWKTITHSWRLGKK